MPPGEGQRPRGLGAALCSPHRAARPSSRMRPPSHADPCCDVWLQGPGDGYLRSKRSCVAVAPARVRGHPVARPWLM